LARRFAQRRHDAPPEAPVTGPEIDAATRVLKAANGDLSLAEDAVDLAVEESQTTRNGFPTHLGGVLQGHFVVRARRARNEKDERKQRAAQHELGREHRHQYKDWCRQRTAERIDKLTSATKQKIIRNRLSTFTDTNRFIIDHRSWSASERRSWIEKRILIEYAREGEPTYEEWSRRHPPSPLH